MPSKRTYKRKQARIRARQAAHSVRAEVLEPGASAASVQLSSNNARTELKHYHLSNDNIQLYHNASNGTVALATNVAVNPFNGISQGAGDTQRIGNDIFVKDVQVRLWLSNKLDRPNVIYRIVALFAPQTSASTIPSFSTVFPNGSNCLNCFQEQSIYTIVYDRVLNPMGAGSLTQYGTGTQKERSFTHELSVPINKVVSYTGTQTAISSMYVFVVCYDTYGSLATDNIASYAYGSRIRFKDP